MLCDKPFTQGNHAYGCGQCLHCRLNRRRVWTHRIILEALVHPGASFLTLTYSEEFLPDGQNLCSRDLQLFIKRLRKRLPIPLRFFACGEYGPETLRPHYHLALFGPDPSFKEHFEAAWSIDGEPIGIVDTGELEYNSAAYVAGYVTKKLSATHPELAGRVPEFARMSNRPGIGAHSIAEVAQVLQSKPGWDEITASGDVPTSLRHGRKTLPLGRYLRTKLRKELGFENEGQPQEASLKQSQEMLAMWMDHVATAENPSLTIKGMLLRETKQKRLNSTARSKLFSQRNRA